MATRAEPLSLAPPRKRWGEAVIKALLALCALVSVATTLGIVLALFLPAIEFFQEVNFVDYITGTEWAPLFLQANFGTNTTAGMGSADRAVVINVLRGLPESVATAA